MIAIVPEGFHAAIHHVTRRTDGSIRPRDEDAGRAVYEAPVCDQDLRVVVAQYMLTKGQCSPTETQNY